MTKREREDAILTGVLIALGSVYACGQETCAEEIVKEVGAAGLLRVAKREQDCFLPDLRKTVNFLRSKPPCAETPVQRKTKDGHEN